MKTASEYLVQGIGIIPTAVMPHAQRVAIMELINFARKETIKECANRIDLFANGKLPKENPKRYMSIYGMYKEEIISLIDELK